MYMLWPVVSDGARVYVTERSYQDPQTTLWALSPADGSVLWSHDFGSLWQVSQPTVDNGHVYLAQVNNNPGTVMYSFVARDGSLLWSQPIADQWDEIWAPLAVGDDVYIESGEYGGMYGFDTADGAQLFYIGLGQYDQWNPLYLNNGIWTYVAGNLEKHDPLTGALRFMATVPWTWVDWSMHTSPISDGTKIYAIAPPNLHAFMPGQTTPVWTTSGSYSGLPAIANGVVYTISGGQMRANDAATGTTLWTFPADGVLNHPPALAGHWAFVASDDHVYAVDTNTHAGVWMGAPGGWLSIADGKLYVAQPNGTLSAWALTP
jgi:outer membrane protein assembly factor BamB